MVFIVRRMGYVCRCKTNATEHNDINSQLEVLDCVYSLWYNAPAMLRAGHQQAASLVLYEYTTSCKNSLVLLRLGEIIARNMLS